MTLVKCNYLEVIERLEKIQTSIHPNSTSSHSTSFLLSLNLYSWLSAEVINHSTRVFVWPWIHSTTPLPDQPLLPPLSSLPCSTHRTEIHGNSHLVSGRSSWNPSNPSTLCPRYCLFTRAVPVMFHSLYTFPTCSMPPSGALTEMKR